MIGERGSRAVAWLLVAALAAAALRRWWLQLGILVAGGPEWAALDLRQRALETRAWFDGEAVYVVFDAAVYPPASYPLFLPFLGWLPDGAMRFVWALLLVASAAALSLLALRVARPAPGPGRWLLALLPWAHYASAAGVGVGQVTLPCLALLGWSVLGGGGGGEERGRGDGSGGSRAGGGGYLAGVLYGLALVKPTLSALFCWQLLAPRHRGRPVVAAVAVYGVLTLVAVAWAPVGAGTLFRQYLRQLPGVPTSAGYGYVRGAWPVFLVAAVAAAVAALAAWRVLRRRRGRWSGPEAAAAFWLLVGLTALVSRVAVYHQLPSDLLVLFPVLGLLRAAAVSGSATRRRVAWGFCGATAVAGLLPMSWHLGGGALGRLFDGVQLALWALLAAVSAAWLVALVRARGRRAGEPAEGTA